ncbi:isochorismate synthase [Thermoactinospora rubra]|uniref:isochorismate synthase n=1 Tax=Thermoactinospora rubra TaxID=1088767 RepID=UPI000A11098B|nr:isochorismate synthase [Thermoactinospora rubra]
MSVALGTTRPLPVRTTLVRDPGHLTRTLPTLPDTAPYAWIRHGEGIIGWGQAARAHIPPGPNRFTWARQWLTELFAHTHQPGPIAFGSFTFDENSPGSVLVIPQTILTRRNGQTHLTTIGDPDPRPATPLRDPGHVSYGDGTLTAPAWQHIVTQAATHIRHGHLEKVVLARDLLATTQYPIDTRVLLTRLATRYPDCYTFSVDGLIGATPELLIRRTGPHIESLVLAGTTPRGTNPADDLARGAALLTSPKDRHEHECAIASVRRALAPLCSTLHTPDQPQLLTLPNVQHLASHVTGHLTDGATVLDVVAALHPTAAVGGTPTHTAVDLIRTLEGMDRAGYAGPVGWIDANGDGEWGIALRSAIIDGTRARLFAGCGIMGDSDPTAELAEAQAKFRVMQYALEG